MCVLTNPHNPSGALTPRPQMLRVLDRSLRTNTRLVVDEAFMDYAPTETLVSEAVQSEPWQGVPQDGPWRAAVPQVGPAQPARAFSGPGRRSRRSTRSRRH